MTFLECQIKLMLYSPKASRKTTSLLDAVRDEVHSAKRFAQARRCCAKGKHTNSFSRRRHEEEEGYHSKTTVTIRARKP